MDKPDSPSILFGSLELGIEQNVNGVFFWEHGCRREPYNWHEVGIFYGRVRETTKRKASEEMLKGQAFGL